MPGVVGEDSVRNVGGKDTSKVGKAEVLCPATLELQFIHS